MQGTPTIAADRLKRNLDAVQQRIAAALDRAGRPADGARLVAVTKSVGPEVILLLRALGVTDFGENRPERLAALTSSLPADFAGRWHMIGTYQRRKVRDTLARFSMVHAVDSEELLAAIAKIARTLPAPPPICFQVNLGGAPTKHGLAPADLPALLAAADREPGLAVAGLMTMAEPDEDESALRRRFAGLRELRDRLRTKRQPLPELSMGMSRDYEIAIEEGATLVRVGSALFEP